LEELLRIKFMFLSGASKAEVDKVLRFDEPGCLSSFTARARMARLLGILEKPVSDAIIMLARLRNDYAHRDKVPVVTEKLLEPVKKALGDQRARNLYDLVRTARGLVPKDLSEGRQSLLVLTWVLFQFLNDARISRLSHQPPPTLIPNSMQPKSGKARDEETKAN
jgi:hypothetical protein